MPLPIDISIPDSCVPALAHLCAKHDLAPKAFALKAVLAAIGTSPQVAGTPPGSLTLTSNPPPSEQVRSIGEHLSDAVRLVAICPQHEPTPPSPTKPMGTSGPKSTRLRWGDDAKALLSLGDNDFVISELRSMGISASRSQVQGARHSYGIYFDLKKQCASSTSRLTSKQMLPAVMP